MNTLELINTNPICFYGLGKENISLIKYLAKEKLISEIVYSDQKTIYNGNLPLPARFIPQSEVASYPVVFKAPGISLYDEVMLRAKEQGAKIVSPNQLFFDLNSAFKICVTGSKGKSTFCKLLAELLQSIGVKAQAAGNIGVPLIELIGQKLDAVVVELSSYQLASLDLAPNYSVITSLFPEHLSWHQTLDNYYRDKLKIVDRAQQTFVFNKELADKISSMKPGIELVQLDFPLNELTVELAPEMRVEIANNYFQPKHLQQSLIGALGVLWNYAKQAGIPLANRIADVENCIKNFKPLPHRLELFYQDQRLQAVDDSISTAPEAVVAALEASAGKEIFLFLGGYCKGTSQEIIINYLNQHPEINVYCYSVTGQKIFKQLSRKQQAYSKTLIEAVEFAWADFSEQKSNNGLFLLSPGAASFDQFRDFEDRGEQFKKLITTRIALG